MTWFQTLHINKELLVQKSSFFSFTTWEVNGATYIQENPSVIVQPVWPHPQMQPPLQQPQQHPHNQQILNIEVLDHIPIIGSGNLRKHQTQQNNKKIPGLKSLKKIKKESELEVPRLCHVCGEQAGKHSYYGGQVCPSCRAFFRRSVQSKYVFAEKQGWNRFNPEPARFMLSVFK